MTDTAVPAWATGEWQQIAAAVLQPPGKNFQPTQLSSDQLQAMRQQLLQSIWQAFLQIVDGFIDPSADPSVQLASWSDDITANVDAVITDIQNTLSGVSAALQQGWLNFQQMIAGVVGDAESDVNDLVTALQATATGASNSVQAWQQVINDLGLGQWIDLSSWLKTAASGTMATKVSGSSVSSDSAQLLSNPNFSGAISIAGNGIWDWDPTCYYVPPGQSVVDPGSATVTANGATQILISGASSDIPLGQPVVYSVQVLTVGLTGSGTLLELFAVPWVGNVAQTPVPLAQTGAPNGTPTGWTNAPSGALAGTLFGTYTPAEASGVTSVSMQLVVTNAAIGGVIRFSAASEELTGGLIADLQDDFAASQAASATLWTAWTAAAAEVEAGNWSGGLAAAEAAWTAYQATEAGIESAEYVTLQELLSTVGINTGSGMMTATNVTSSLGLASLEHDVDTFLGWFGLPDASTSTNNLWTAVTRDIINPLNTIEAQANNVILAGEKDLTDFFDNIFEPGADPTTAQVAAASVSGTQGIPDIGTTSQNTWDSIATSIATALGLTGVASSGNPLSAMATAVQSHAIATASALNQATDNTNNLNSIQAHPPTHVGLGPVVLTNMSMFDIYPAATAQAGITPSASTWGVIAVPTDTDIESITIIGVYYAASGWVAPTTAVLNLYSLNTTTGLATQLFTSPNFAGDVSGSSNNSAVAPIVVNLGQVVTIPAGTTLLVEGCLTASNTNCKIYLAAAEVNAPIFPSIYPGSLAGGRGYMSSTVSPASFTPTYSPNTIINPVPYIALNGPQAVPYHAPVVTFHNTSTPYTVPAWATAVDIIPLGGGGSGGVGLLGAGNAGGNTVVTMGSDTVMALGGSGGASGDGRTPSDSYGQGTGDFYNSRNFPGGTTVGYGQLGSSPGGGGGAFYSNSSNYGFGGQAGQFNPVTWAVSGGETINFTIGAGGVAAHTLNEQNGAPGGAWVVAYQ